MVGAREEGNTGRRTKRVTGPAIASGALLRAEGASLAYFDGDRTTFAVDTVTVELPVRGFVGIMGPSGSGKSSLLYLLSGLKKATAGAIAYGERRYSEMSERQLTELRRARFGFVFQQPFLLNYLTVQENILVAACRGALEPADHVRALLESLDISRFASRHPFSLSGGERQRVCVARAMMNDPDVIFADEPTASLDHRNGHAVVNLITSYRERGLVIVVTHDPEMLIGADRVLNMRDGRLEE